MEDINNVTLNAEAIDVDAIEIKPVDYKELTKQDLIRMCEEKDSLLKCYEESANSVQAHHDKEIENLNKHYMDRIKELTSLVKYYVRKNKLVIDLLTIEEDPEKGAKK